MILVREKYTFSRSRDCHGLFFMNKQRMCVWAQAVEQGCKSGLVKKSETLQLMLKLHGCSNICLEW